MRIKTVEPLDNYTLVIQSEDGRKGIFDVRPYLEYEAFEELKLFTKFILVKNGGYYLEWDCGADLSADTIEAGLIDPVFSPS